MALFLQIRDISAFLIIFMNKRYIPLFATWEESLPK